MGYTGKVDVCQIFTYITCRKVLLDMTADVLDVISKDMRVVLMHSNFAYYWPL